MNFKLNFKCYPTFEINELLNCWENPIDYIREKATNLICDYDKDYYIEELIKKFELISELFNEFNDKEVVKGILEKNLEDLIFIDRYQEFLKGYSNEEWFEVEVNVEINLTVFYNKYNQYIKIESIGE